MVCSPPTQTRPVSACTRPREGTSTFNPSHVPLACSMGTLTRHSIFPHMSPLGHPIHVMSSAPAEGTQAPGFARLTPPAPESPWKARQRGWVAVVKTEGDPHSEPQQWWSWLGQEGYMRPPEQRWHDGESGKTHSVSLAPSSRGHREGKVATRCGLQPPTPGPVALPT